MTPHTDRPAASPLVGSTRAYRALVAMIVAMTIVLTAWTAAQAAVLNGVLEAAGPREPSIRQLERAAAVERVGPEYPSIRQLERAAQVREDELLRLEYSELRRFRHHVPVWALPVLDAEIERLRQAIASDQQQ